MKVACILLTLDREDLARKVIAQNFFNAGVSADVFLIDNGSDPETFKRIKESYPFTKVHRFEYNQGIAKAINKGIELAIGYEAIVTLANDILMPQGWLKSLIEHTERIQETGITAIHCVESLPELTERGVHETFRPFGNALITMKAIKKVGGFNTDFGIYGMEDSDYGYRTTKAGFINYYVPNLKAEHIGHDVGQDSKYRLDKDKSLQKAEAIYLKAVKEYDKGNYYLKTS
jgi:GT2 family glycosyltransferase